MMGFLESLRTAASGLSTNKLRAALTVLGIIIGVGSVVALMSLGQGVQASISGQIQSIGSNLVLITPERAGGSSQPAYLTSTDVVALQDPINAPSLAAVAPTNQGQLPVGYGGQTTNMAVVGTTPQYAQVRALTPALGGFLDQADLDNQTRVAVLGYGAYATLFPNGDYPVGQSITINGMPFQVVGLLQQTGGLAGEDNSIYIPLTTAETRFFTQRTLSGAHVLSAIFVSVASPSQVNAAMQEITTVLDATHNIAPGGTADFSVVSQQQILNVANQITGILTLFLSAIAGISLLVGGIGIMNIMLVSVTERTREIGIRKAIGATRGDILLQFVLEAIVLSLVGGLLGIGLGVLGAGIVSNLSTQIVAKVTVGIVLLAAGVAGGIGLAFGVYPALRAANLRPIEALRYE